MSDNITRTSYAEEVQSIANSLCEEALADADGDRDQAEEDINDSRLHETIDGHQWIIYNAYNDDVIRYSDNSDAYQDCYGNEDVGRVVTEGGLDKMRTIQAFFAMEADVRDQLSDAMDNAVEAWEAKQKKGKKKKPAKV